MPTISLKILTFSVFCLFCFFGYYLIKATHEESDQREMAERIIIRERALREDAEQLAGNLQRLDQAKNQFMLSTQHHLRSPLTVIQGYLSLIEEGVYGKINKKVAQKVHNALAESQKLIKVVNDLLDMAKYQMNENTVERQTSNIVAILRDVISDLFQTAGKKNLKLDYQDSGQLPSVVINAKGIREALYNIIDNAIKYTEQGGVTVRSELINTNILISITDTGIGMEEIDRLGLFKRTFERGDKAKAINTTGKGIGLYLSAQMVLANGGNIWVMSKGRGSGTTFYIELPIADSKAVTPPSVPTKSEKIDQLYESANLSKPE
jgi:signal transduction histidine kinase